ncbi:MAG: FAD-dependent oxidoreductase, partial [Planctomycetota bacterium]
MTADVAPQQLYRGGKQVIDDRNQVYDYDQLVLATGSHAFVPPIPGAALEGVFVYRTLNDLESIREYCRVHSVHRGAVIGGGLLGLEAAKIMTDLGLQVSVIEMAPGLMPRQLNSEEAVLLRERIEAMGLDIHLVRRTESIVRNGETLTLRFGNADDLQVDLLIIAAGVRPNDQLAESAGLELSSRRGIVIDRSLRTSDASIYAIGECAAFDDHVFGLAAPCYRMADVLAKRLGGGDDQFQGADESAELKLMGVQVATLGAQIGESPGGVVIKHEDDSGIRKLLIERGKIVGASCVGPWAELAQVRQAINRQATMPSLSAETV